MKEQYVEPVNPLPMEALEVRMAEELEERTEFCDWLSVCTSCCGDHTSSPTASCTSPGNVTCPTTTK